MADSNSASGAVNVALSGSVPKDSKDLGSAIANHPINIPKDPNSGVGKEKKKPTRKTSYQNVLAESGKAPSASAGQSPLEIQTRRSI